MNKKSLNLFEMAQAQLDEVASILNLESGIHAILREPMREQQTDSALSRLIL